MVLAIQYTAQTQREAEGRLLNSMMKNVSHKPERFDLCGDVTLMRPVRNIYKNQPT